MRFLASSILLIVVLHLFSSQVIHRIPTMVPALFPVMTIFLMVFHILIAGFMLMKYLCDKHRLYLVAIACAFGGSSLLMIGTLSSYADWLLCSSISSINFNDALIHYFFRNVLMAALFITSVILYQYRHSNIHTRRNHIVILSGLLVFTLTILFLSWKYSSNSPGVNLEIIDDLTKKFTPLWHNYLIVGMIALWGVTLTVMLAITRLRNIFWYSGYLFCLFYIFTLVLLLPVISIEGYSWYQSRLFETTATLFLIFVLLCDVFTLYRESNNKYENSYQNSIRDPMTRLFNRSFFYDSLKKQMAGVSASSPVSVIVCDLDHFKRINDCYGHLQGDKVIQFVSAILQDNVRLNDVAARIGGEEFALLLTNTDAENALDIAERIRQTVYQHDEESSHGQLPEKITISMGVYTATQAEAEQEACVQRADIAMYQAKAQGRNRVVVWQP
ncbi:GGDEF domain-containing protein [Enterobacter sp. CC120223-11]|uniref:sensor domain-containing diguanylate cyclase n=1 Tax=Enterobacter sp. CC120223-11 TaxID=1378073 RepID=UPI000BCB3F69|nr:GGDEF domain-containing protein [Enterobacter sp. CC120223-11]SNY74468.1 diguanylate cyclase (GGDEF) domain-containing protein [Enterobacter sp. CC120223-11]